jgi:hypothetical protein
MVTLAQSFPAPSQPAPKEWGSARPTEDCRLHQLAPYIGKLKPVIARHLITRFTKPRDLVLDCFAGSGTIPVEAVLLGRRVLAFDANPYAVVLTRAKLGAPASLEDALGRLEGRLTASQARPKYQISNLPDWVQKFFHPDTLQDALLFADECIEREDYFLLACLLSILHHQRPGFLSFPSSHLVPYLRDRNFPRSHFPDLYTKRDIAPRLAAKVSRLYKYEIKLKKSLIISSQQKDINEIRLARKIDTIITSPPYMNALDYVRDNRLRMWFLDRSVTNYSPEPTEKQEQFDSIIGSFSTNIIPHLRVGGHCILVVGETVRRKRMISHPAERMLSKLVSDHPNLVLQELIEDQIPDIRRSRKEGSATKRELILVLKKTDA